MDLVGAALGLVLFAALFPPIALAIALSSGVPILFVQERVGQDGRPFPLVKFRTLPLGAGSRATGSDGEDRITGVGRFLRRSGLDELPQFINVLRGEMSLVGPRPELPELYAGYAPWQRRRVEVLPGMTGWWQVQGRPQPMADHIRHDIYYLENRCLALDLRILLLTVPSLVLGRAPGRRLDPDGGRKLAARSLPAARADRE